MMNHVIKPQTKVTQMGESESSKQLQILVKLRAKLLTALLKLAFEVLCRGCY